MRMVEPRYSRKGDTLVEELKIVTKSSISKQQLLSKQVTCRGLKLKRLVYTYVHILIFRQKCPNPHDKKMLPLVASGGKYYF